MLARTVCLAVVLLSVGCGKGANHSDGGAGSGGGGVVCGSVA
jgi:hypothetical protein